VIRIRIKVKSRIRIRIEGDKLGSMEADT
jgi:hypothetical protein